MENGGESEKKKSFSVRNSLYGNQALSDTRRKSRVPNVLNGWFVPPCGCVVSSSSSSSSSLDRYGRGRPIEFDGGGGGMDFNQARNSFYHVRDAFHLPTFPLHLSSSISHVPYFPFSMETSRRELVVLCVSSLGCVQTDSTHAHPLRLPACQASLKSPPPLFLLRYYSTPCWLEFLKKN